MRRGFSLIVDAKSCIKYIISGSGSGILRMFRYAYLCAIYSNGKREIRSDVYGGRPRPGPYCHCCVDVGRLVHGVRSLSCPGEIHSGYSTFFPHCGGPHHVERNLHCLGDRSGLAAGR